MTTPLSICEGCVECSSGEKDIAGEDTNFFFAVLTHGVSSNAQRLPSQKSAKFGLFRLTLFLVGVRNARGFSLQCYWARMAGEGKGATREGENFHLNNFPTPPFRPSPGCIKRGKKSFPFFSLCFVPTNPWQHFSGHFSLDQHVLRHPHLPSSDTHCSKRRNVAKEMG